MSFLMAICDDDAVINCFLPTQDGEIFLLHKFLVIRMQLKFYSCDICSTLEQHENIPGDLECLLHTAAYQPNSFKCSTSIFIIFPLDERRHFFRRFLCSLKTTFFEAILIRLWASRLQMKYPIGTARIVSIR